MKRIKLSTLKPLVWERDRGVCVCCGDPIQPGWGEVHHRRFRSRGGRDELANLILTCQSCHARIHLFEPELSASNGWAVSRYGDGPETIPVRYYDGRIVLLSNDMEAAA